MNRMVKKFGKYYKTRDNPDGRGAVRRDKRD